MQEKSVFLNYLQQFFLCFLKKLKFTEYGRKVFLEYYPDLWMDYAVRIKKNAKTSWKIHEDGAA